MTRTKQIDLLESVIDGIITDYRRLNNACDAAIKAGAMDIDGPLHEAIWRSFQGMLERIDENGWISWFIYDNDCGAKAMKAKGCGKRGMTQIKTPRHLARLIVEENIITPRTPDSNAERIHGGAGIRPSCPDCYHPLGRNSLTDGWWACEKCDEAKYKAEVLPNNQLTNK